MSTRIDHRKPAFAFALLLVIAIAVVSSSMRARADLTIVTDAPSGAVGGQGLPSDGVPTRSDDTDGDRGHRPGGGPENGPSLPSPDVPSLPGLEPLPSSDPGEPTADGGLSTDEGSQGEEPDRDTPQPPPSVPSQEQPTGVSEPAPAPPTAEERIDPSEAWTDALEDVWGVPPTDEEPTDPPTTEPSPSPDPTASGDAVLRPPGGDETPAAPAPSADAPAGP